MIHTLMEDECPLNKDELGYHTWNLLHSMAAYFPNQPTAQQRSDIEQFFHILSRLYPCEACAHHFASLLATRPPVTDSQATLSEWLCLIHNQINKRIGKPLFDCNKLNRRWRDGRADGSCD